MKERNDTKIPEFQSLEEEREYWEGRGPLAKGHKGRLQEAVPRVKRASFLSVRLNGDELTQLRDMAAESDMSVSTFVRFVIKSLAQEWALGKQHFSFLYDSTGKHKTGLKEPVDFFSKTFLAQAKKGVRDKSSFRNICILNDDDLSQAESYLRILNDYMTFCKKKIITLKTHDYEKLEGILQQEEKVSRL